MTLPQVYREGVRVLVALFVAGCGFTPSAPNGVAGPDASDSVSDGPGSAVPMDAPAHVFMDAPSCGDDDDDGVCNEVDDWPCGAKPQAIVAQHDLYANGTLSHFALSMIAIDGAGTLVTAAHGTTVRVQMHYAATDSACADCQDQLEIGWHPTGHRAACIFDNDVPSGSTHTGNLDDSQLRAPQTPGVYELRMQIGQNYSCNHNGADDWWGGNEPSDVIAKLCIQ